MSDVICAGHAIKEIMSAGDCLTALGAGVQAAGSTVAGSYIISDGGDGFLEACQRFSAGEIREVLCTAPLGDEIEAPFLYDEGTGTAYIEIAQCSGLQLVEPARRNVMISGSAGLGDMVAAAREIGARRIMIGLGGSATCDGGIGFLWSLADHAGLCPPGTCEPRIAMDLPELSAPDIPAIREWLNGIELFTLIDVENPLLGENGAAKVFAPQKGADPEQAEQLDAWLGEWCQRVQRNAGVGLCGTPGTGAAGGLGFAMAVIGAELLPGAKTVCELSGLVSVLRADSTLITAEGKFDSTSLGGKAPWIASELAVDKGGKAAIFCGISEDDAARVARESGVAVIEYGRNLSQDERQPRSADRLSESVRDYLQKAAGIG